MNNPKKSKIPLILRLVAYGITLGLMASILIPNVREARVTTAANACVANLKQIEGASRSWSLENKKGPDDLVDIHTAKQYLRGGVLPTCPAGGTYIVNRVKDRPVCSKAAELGHSLPR